MPIEDPSVGEKRFFVASKISGRVRFKLPELYRNEELAKKIYSFFEAQTEIKKVQINIYSRSVLICYDPQHSSAKILDEKLHNLLTNYQMIDEETQQVKQATASTIEENLDFTSTPPEPIIFKKWQDPWHQLPLSKIKSILNTDLKRGLDSTQAENLIKLIGLNEFPREKPPSILALLFEQLNEFLPKLLLGASAVSALLGQFGDAITIAAIVLVESALGVWQNLKAERSLDTLQQYSQINCRVIRNGKLQELPAKLLVPGDLITLQAGDLIPADVRIIDSSNLKVTEAPLTGESEPVSKTQKIKYTSKIPLVEQKNMLFMGTTIVQGTAKAIIVQTGIKTELGQIANLIKETEPEPTPLQKDLERLAKTLTLGCLGISAGIMAINLFQGYPLLATLRSGISLAIGTVPEGLTAVLAVALSFGVQRMAKKGAIVKKLPVVESLSCADIICTDKTGTLTKGEMTVQKIYTTSGLYNITGIGYSSEGDIQKDGVIINPKNHPELSRVIQIGALCNNASYQINGDQINIVGDPSEGALWVLAAKGNYSLKTFNSFTRKKEIPFSSTTKKMITLCQDKDQKYIINVKGAPDLLLNQCTQIFDGNSVREITQKDRMQIEQAMENLANQALRVMGFAYQEMDNQPKTEQDLEANLIFAGLMGMMDPPRAEVAESIRQCQNAGIRVIMITGDHPKTATAIGRQIGLLTKDDLVVTGQELVKLSKNELAQQIDHIAIFARTSPHQKLQIVKALQSRGHIVAMTGDGVNDAPAIKAADIGIAMGKNGTDVTREASSIILTDDNFTTIVKAIEEGRTISNNIKKFMRFILAGNVGQILAIGIAALLGLPAPLLPGAILMVDLATEGITSLALGVDPPDKSNMDQPPRDATKSIFDLDVVKRILSRGIVMGISTFGFYVAGLHLTGNLAMARTMAYTSLVISQLYHVFDCRTAPLANNKLVIPAVVAASLLLAISIYIPSIANTLGVCGLRPTTCACIILISGCIGKIENWIKQMKKTLGNFMLRAFFIFMKRPISLLPPDDDNQYSQSLKLSE